MTLHEAIQKVLEQAGGAMSAAAIAKQVNALGLYTRGDRAPVPANQIAARVRCKTYANRFVVGDGVIDLAARRSSVSRST